MTSTHDFLVQGDPARLFPVLADTNREQRATSIFLAVVSQVPSLAETILKSISVKVGKRTRIEAYTEVVLKQETSSGGRPDGLLIVHSSRKAWAALIETKIGNAQLDADQVSKYLDLARANNIDAVITISNQFVARPEHSPVDVSKNLLRKTRLYHWSWNSIWTQSEILEIKKSVEDRNQVFLVEELNRFFSHPKTGVERFTQMVPAWRDIVQSVTNGANLTKTTPNLDEVVSSWHSEERDLCLQMSRHVGRQVRSRMPSDHARSAERRLKDGIASLIETTQLKSNLLIPDCASDIEIGAHLMRKTVSVSMKLRTPENRKSTRARVNWMLHMLKMDDPRLFINAHWPGKVAPTLREVVDLRKDPNAIQANNSKLVPHTLEVLLIDNLGKGFSGRRTFIESLERIVPDFYDLVGVNLRAWHASPPKPVKGQEGSSRDDAETSEVHPIETTGSEEFSRLATDDDGLIDNRS